jgi:hypothetical protein
MCSCLVSYLTLSSTTFCLCCVSSYYAFDFRWKYCLCESLFQSTLDHADFAARLVSRVLVNKSNLDRLRSILWILHKVSGKESRLRETTGFLLQHPRRYFAVRCQVLMSQVLLVSLPRQADLVFVHGRLCVDVSPTKHFHKQR